MNEHRKIDWRPALRFALRNGTQQFIDTILSIVDHECDAAFRRECAEVKAEHAAHLAKMDAALLAKADEVYSKLQAEFAEENRRLVAANRALTEENSKLVEENRKLRALCGAEAVRPGPVAAAVIAVASHPVISNTAHAPHLGRVLINPLSVSAAKSMSASLGKRPKCCVATKSASGRSLLHRDGGCFTAIKGAT